MVMIGGMVGSLSAMVALYRAHHPPHAGDDLVQHFVQAQAAGQRRGAIAERLGQLALLTLGFLRLLALGDVESCADDGRFPAPRLPAWRYSPASAPDRPCA